MSRKRSTTSTKSGKATCVAGSMVATVFATITYEAGLTPPGGFWQDAQIASQLSCNCTGINTTNMTTPGQIHTTLATNGTEHVAGHPILQDTNHLRYKSFFWTNTLAFVYSISMRSIMFLLSDTLSSRLDQSGLKLIMVINAIILVGAYSAGCSRDLSDSILPRSEMAVVIVYYAVKIIIRKKRGHHNSKENVWKAAECRSISRRTAIAGVMDA